MRELGTRRVSGLIVRVACAALCFWVVRTFYDAYEGAREAARKSQCTGNFKQVALALHNYNATWGALPPAVTTDAGRPMHSWRVLILPYLEQPALYQSYNFNQPWNGPDNRKLAGSMPGLYGCPSHRSAGHTGNSIVAITGPGTMFDGRNSRSIESLKPGESACTVCFAEIADTDIPWMEPRDLDMTNMSFRINDPKRPSISTVHPGGPTIGMVDGSIWTLRPDTKPAAVKSILRINATGLPDQGIGAY